MMKNSDPEQCEKNFNRLRELYVKHNKRNKIIQLEAGNHITYHFSGYERRPTLHSSDPEELFCTDPNTASYADITNLSEQHKQEIIENAIYGYYGEITDVYPYHFSEEDLIDESECCGHGNCDNDHWYGNTLFFKNIKITYARHLNTNV